MLSALTALGVNAKNLDGHQNHFHLEFRTPTRLDLDKSLLVDSTTPTIGDSAISTNFEEVVAWVRTDLNLEAGEEAMLTLDLPEAPSASQVVLIAQALQSASQVKERAIGVCQPVDRHFPTKLDGSYWPDFAGGLGPETIAREYFIRYDKRTDVPLPPLSAVEVLVPPQHGVVKLGTNGGGDPQYNYIPDVNYLGKDKVTFRVTTSAGPVVVHYYLVVTNKGAESKAADRLCNKLTNQPSSTWVWKISSSFTTPALDNAALQALLDAIRINSGVTVTISDLSGGTVGSASGSAITLDDNAGGYGWYIDYTPYLNDEYLPTSNPNLWVAKEGSESEGKMDLLSVLLHEYGHALGIEHSPDSRDFMAATLQPGVRRLPSADELSLMAQLAGQAKLALEGNGAPDTPQSPGLPIGAGLSALLVGRLRSTRYGSWSPAFDSLQIPAPIPQFEVAANPTLANGKLESGEGWATQGNVAINNGTATLSEVSTSQTRLNQVFMVGPHDRYLTFTVANIALDDQASNAGPLPNPLPQAGEGANGAASGSGMRPSDAFEAALLDANTGASLLGATGLTRTDAFLNLQANGTERAGQQVTSTLNADGSRTYRVDLSGIPAGAAVNLSFDLIGFGAATSRVTVRDIRLGVPETHDDSAVTQEDTPIDIAATANDLDADQPGFVPVIVTGPAHGEVVVNPDGSFRYTPASNWYGADSFSYKLSDGSVDSNLATVSLTVSPVNDAPVVADIAAVTAEDTAVTLDLLVAASDIDSATLTSHVVAAPSHGTLTANTDGSFAYTPNADWNGEDVFTYKVSDGELDSGIATVRIAVAAVNDAPVAVDDAVATAEDTAVQINVLANDHDIDSATLTPQIVAGPAHGTLTANADGTPSPQPSDGTTSQFD